VSVAIASLVCLKLDNSTVLVVLRRRLQGCIHLGPSCPCGGPMQQESNGSAPSAFAAFLAASVTTYHAQSEPHQCAE
jgi:hypothetical protein